MGQWKWGGRGRFRCGHLCGHRRSFPVLLFLVFVFAMRYFLVSSPNRRPVRQFDIRDRDFNRPGISTASKIAGFYHVFTTGDYYHRIVNEQVNFMNESGLLRLTSNIFYVTVGENLAYNISQSFPFEGAEKFVNVAWFSDAWEVETLGFLYQYCMVNPLDKVFYFHTKGAYHQREENEIFRKTLGCYALTDRCLKVLDEFDTCGMRYSPVPHMHYPGNFWWARCSYVNTLIDPRQHEKHTNAVKEHVRKRKKKSKVCFGEGRFFGETWIGSHPNLNAADCLGPLHNTSYMYGYERLPRLDDTCSYIIDSPPGEPQPKCGVAATNSSDLSRLNAPPNLVFNLETDVCGEIVKHLVRRAQVWYPNENIDKFRRFIKHLKRQVTQKTPKSHI